MLRFRLLRCSHVLGVVPPAGVIRRQKEAMMSWTLAGGGVCTGGHTLNGCTWREWELRRNWQGGCSVPHWRTVSGRVMCDSGWRCRFHFYPASPAETGGGGCSRFESSSTIQCATVMLGNAPCTGRLTIALSHLRDQYNLLVCGSAGIASNQRVAVCTAARGDWGHGLWRLTLICWRLFSPPNIQFHNSKLFLTC